MFQEDIQLVKSLAREIAKEEIAKALNELKPAPPIIPPVPKPEPPPVAHARYTKTKTT